MSKEPQTSVSDQVGSDGIRWLLRLPHSSHGEYMVSSGSCVVPTYVKCINARALDRALWWTMFRTHTTRQGLCKSGRGGFWYPEIDFQILFFQQVHAGSSYANPTQDLTSAATRGVDHATQIDKGVDHFNMSAVMPPGLLSKAWMGNLEYFGFRPVYLKTKAAASSCIIVVARTSTCSICDIIRKVQVGTPAIPQWQV